MYKLIIYDEKGEVREFDLSPGTYHLGRSKNNDIYLNDQKVSRSHAHIQLDPDGRIFIEDLNSKEGTAVNGESINKKTDLKDGDAIVISSFTLEVKKWMGEMETMGMGPSEEGETPLSESGTDLGPDGTIKIDPDDSDAIELSKYHKLLIISGKRFGEEYVLDKPVLTIGSSASKCDIFIDDKKVSDEHARVVVSDGKCVLENLAANNETLVNGKYTKESIPLKKGDCIEIDSVLFRFIDKDEVVQKDKLKSLAQSKGLKKSKKKTLLIALVLMSAILVLLVLYKPQKGPSEPKARPGSASPEASKIKKVPEKKKLPKKTLPEKNLSLKQEVDIYFDIGNDFFKKRQWKKAGRKFKEVLRINPKYPGAFNKMERAMNENNNLRILENSRALIISHDYEKGLKELEKIPGDSVYYDEGLAEMIILQTGMAQKKASDEEEGNRLIEGAIEDYLRGNTRDTFNKLDAVLKLNLEDENLLNQKASDLSGDLKNILDFFHKGHNEYNNDQIEMAFATWSKGLLLEKRVIGKIISHDSKSIRDIIADRESREARKAFESGDFPGAHKFCEKVLAIYPEHKESLEISNIIHLRAKKLYQEGYIIKDLNPDQSLLKMKEVLSITSPDSEYYKKAHSIITGISRN